MVQSVPFSFALKLINFKNYYYFKTNFKKLVELACCTVYFYDLRLLSVSKNSKFKFLSFFFFKMNNNVITAKMKTRGAYLYPPLW